MLESAPMQWLLEPLELQYMRLAVIAAILFGVTGATLGVYVVYRRMAFIGGALAHTALPGLAIAYVNGFPLIYGALVADLLTALGIGYLSRRRVREDTAIGILFTTMFALGILIMSHQQTFTDLTGLLFGNVLTVDQSSLWLIAGVCTLVLVALGLFHKELQIASFDPNFARAAGINTDAMRYLLLVLLALNVVAGLQIVGVVLTSAMLVIPAATASQLSHRLGRQMVIGSFVAVFSGVGGLYASYHAPLSWNIPAGAAIVLLASLLFLLAYGFASLKQWLSTRAVEPEPTAADSAPPGPGVAANPASNPVHAANADASPHCEPHRQPEPQHT